jgi:hypothetical protein
VNDIYTIHKKMLRAARGLAQPMDGWVADHYIVTDWESCHADGVDLLKELALLLASQSGNAEVRRVTINTIRAFNKIRSGTEL